MTARPDNWTPEAIETLRRMWLDGASAQQIAVAIGPAFTKNSVISKRRRLDLPGRASPIRTTRKPKPPPKPKAVRVVAPLPPPDPVYPPPLALTGVGGRVDACQWILGDACGAHTIYCGKPVERKSWCEEHTKKVFSPMKLALLKA